MVIDKEVIINAGPFILLAMSLFFWCRGITKAHITDYVAGVILFLLSPMAIPPRPAYGSDPGVLMASFGVATLIANRCAKGERPWARQVFDGIAILTIVLALLLGTIC